MAAAHYLGLDPDSAERSDPAFIEKFTSCGWTWNNETKLFHPKPVQVVKPIDNRSLGRLSEVMALVGNSGG